MNKIEKIAKKIIGYILITPALLSVFFFLEELLFLKNRDIMFFDHQSYLPFFTCFLALIGVYLIKD